MSDKNDKGRLNPYWEAAKESPNVLGLTGLAALSLATLNPIPLLCGVVAETAYLVSVPDSAWYRKRVSQRETERDREEKLAHRQQLLPKLPLSHRERFGRLERCWQGLDPGAPTERLLYDEIKTKLGDLLDSYLLFAEKDLEFRNYLYYLSVKTSEEPPAALPDKVWDESWPEQAARAICAHHNGELTRLETQHAKADDPTTLEVMAKRIDVLRRRIEHVQSMGRILTQLDQQMHLVEDTFGLISDEMRAHLTQNVLDDVNEVVVQANVTSNMLHEVRLSWV